MNDDNVDEIICIASSPENRTTWGYELHVFQRKGFNYTDISTMLGVETDNKIEILDTKNSGFYDLKIHYADNSPLIAKYKEKIKKYQF